MHTMPVHISVRTGFLMSNARFTIQTTNRNKKNLKEVLKKNAYFDRNPV